jgi:isopentenyl phosphate kinase
MQELALIKLGGSLITDKDTAYTARPEMIQQLVREVHLIRNQNPHLKLIIGNGAGSFGHQSAKKYNTIDGFVSDSEKLGFCLVHQDALELNFLITKTFLQADLPVVSLPPLAIALTHNKQLQEIDFSAIENSLQAGLIPFVCGDVVLDRVIGGTILSTDRLLAECAKYFHVQGWKVQLVNAGNYPGVYDHNGQVLPHITSSNYPHIKAFLGNSQSVDVTGGMASKVAEFLAISNLGINCWIIDGTIPENLAQVVLGQSSLGTLIQGNFSPE